MYLDNYLTRVDAQFLVGIVFVFVNGFLIGYERGHRGEPAGVRTYTLICFGAMLFTLLSRYVDPLSTSRIAANIVTGVGFLGAGIIMYHQGSIRGLTTAASLWLSAAIGMAIGYGYYLVSFIGAVATFIILKMPHIGEHGPLNYENGDQNQEKTENQKKKFAL